MRQDIATLPGQGERLELPGLRGTQPCVGGLGHVACLVLYSWQGKISLVLGLVLGVDGKEGSRH